MWQEWQLWDFVAGDRLLASIDNHGRVWCPSPYNEPISDVRWDGGVYVGGELVGFADSNGSFWDSSMKYLGWAQKGRNAKSPQRPSLALESERDSIVVYALGGHEVVACADVSCSLMSAAAVGVALWSTGAVDWQFEDDWRAGWLITEAPSIQFPRLTFRPIGGVLTSQPDYLRLSRELSAKVGSWAGAVHRSPFRRRALGLGTNHRSLGAAMLNSAITDTLDRFRSSLDSTHEATDTVNMLLRFVTAEQLPSTEGGNRRLRPLVEDWLTSRLLPHARVDRFEPRVDCLPVDTLPLEADLKVSDVSSGFNSGWITGWRRSITIANKFSRPDHDWAFATSCLETDPRVKWWLRVRPASMATIPIGDPLNLERVRPEFVVVDSDGMTWAVMLENEELRDLDRTGFRSSLERWIRSTQWAACDGEWRLMVVDRLPTQIPTWAKLVSQFEVRP